MKCIVCRPRAQMLEPVFVASCCSRRRGLGRIRLVRLFNPMVFVQSRIAMPDIFAPTFSLLAIAAFICGFREQRTHVVRARRARFRPFDRLKWSGLFALAI
jgi:4-amino-4-deoxy-L-arabinose transferase-like glycosyltransferase